MKRFSRKDRSINVSLGYLTFPFTKRTHGKTFGLEGKKGFWEEVGAGKRRVGGWSLDRAGEGRRRRKGVRTPLDVIFTTNSQERTRIIARISSEEFSRANFPKQTVR